MDHAIWSSIYAMDRRWRCASSCQHSKFHHLACYHFSTLGRRTLNKYHQQFNPSGQGAAAGIMHGTRSGGDCNWTPSSSGFVDGVLSCDQPQDLSVARCRETLTVEAVGWVLFGLCVLTLLATCLWVRTSKRSYVSDSRRLV